MRLLEDSMAERMLSGDIKEGDSVIIDVDADGQVRRVTCAQGACFTAAVKTCTCVACEPDCVAGAAACLSGQRGRDSHKKEVHLLIMAIVTCRSACSMATRR